MEKQLALGWSFLGAGKAIANTTTSLMNEAARVDIKPTVLWGVVMYAQASDLLFDPEELGGDEATRYMGKCDLRKW